MSPLICGAPSSTVCSGVISFYLNGGFQAAPFTDATAPLYVGVSMHAGGAKTQLLGR